MSKGSAEEVGGKVMDVWVFAIAKVLFSNTYAFRNVGICKRASKHNGWRDVPIMYTLDHPEVGEGTRGQVDGGSVEAVDIPFGCKECPGSFESLAAAIWA
jgi:hypothetical protein